MRLSGSSDQLEPFGVSKLASRIFLAGLAGGGDASDASLGADRPPAGCAIARCPGSGDGKRAILRTLPVPSSVSAVMAGAPAGLLTVSVSGA